MAQTARPTAQSAARQMTVRQLMTPRLLWILACASALIAIALTTLFVANLNSQNAELANGSNAEANANAMSQSQNEKVPVLCAEKLRLERSYKVKNFFTAEIVPKRSADLSFQRAGKIIKVLVDEGASVKHKQVLARLDRRHLVAQQKQQEAQREQAKSMLDELVRGPRNETIRAARAQVEDVQQQLSREQKQLERSTQLVDQNAISKQQHEQTLFGVRALEAKLELATSQLDELLAGTRSEQVDAQKAVVDSIKASIESIKYDLEDCEILAPFDGVITRRWLDEGTTVNPGTVVCQLIENDALEIHAGMPLEFGSSLSVDDEVEVLFDERVSDEDHAGALDSAKAHESKSQPVSKWTTSTGKARIKSIIQQLDNSTRTLKIILVFVPRDTNNESKSYPDVTAGQTVRLAFDRSIADRGFWVPMQALISDHRGLWSCFVWQPAAQQSSDERPRDGVVRRQSVEVLYDDNDRAFVRGTINENDWLVVEGVHRLSDRQRILVKKLGASDLATQNQQ